MIKLYPKIYQSLLFCFLLFAACDDLSDDSHYTDDGNLQDPIYSVLKEDGDFSMYLKCVDNAGYKDVLNSSGYYTVFAPTDEAFSTYLTENGYSSVDDMSESEAKDLVQYSMVFTAFTEETIDDAYNSDGETDENTAYRRKTLYYKGVYTDTVDVDDLGVVKVIDFNYVPDESDIGTTQEMDEDDNNYKWIPVFTSNFMSENDVAESDYLNFFPTSTLSDFNVAGAQVTQSDIQCENGYVQVVDKVIEPLRNLLDIIDSKEDYSMFANILEKYLASYNIAPDDVIDNYNDYYGSSGNVYCKSYPDLTFSPNTETIESSTSYGEDQSNTLTVFAPDNTAIQAFYDDIFLKWYSSLDEMSDELIADFINSHLFTDGVWPSKFEEWETKFTASDIEESEMGSNGFFYGTNRVQESDYFFTVWGEINLNPDYSLFKQACEDNSLNYTLMSSTDFTVFLVDDEDMQNVGFTYDSDLDEWSYNESTTNATSYLARWLGLHIILGEVDDFSEGDMIQTYGTDGEGEYIKYENGELYAAGNYEDGNTGVEPLTNNDLDPNNGITYKFDGNSLLFSATDPITLLLQYPDFSMYCSYLMANEDLFTVDDDDENAGTIEDLSSGAPNTMFVLNNTVMQQAIDDGLLPSDPATTDVEEQAEVKAFFQYHMIPNYYYPLDSEDADDEFTTAYKDEEGTTEITIHGNSDGSGYITDNSGSKVSFSTDDSRVNILSNRLIIHELQGYLNYND